MYEKLEALMEKEHINAYKLSKETGIPQTCLSDYKKGRAKPKADKLKILSDYFGVPIEYFIDEEV